MVMGAARRRRWRDKAVRRSTGGDGVVPLEIYSMFTGFIGDVFWLKLVVVNGNYFMDTGYSGVTLWLFRPTYGMFDSSFSIHRQDFFF